MVIIRPAVGRMDSVEEKEGGPRRTSAHVALRPWLGRTLAAGNALLFSTLVLSTLGAARTIYGQEVVVFTDFRSLVVSSHREAGPWVYLRVGSGELGVQKSQIAEIRNEGPQAEVAARAVPQPAFAATEDDLAPAPATEESVVVMEPPDEKAPPKQPTRGPMEGVVRPMGLRNHQPVQLGTIGGAGPNSLRK